MDFLRSHQFFKGLNCYHPGIFPMDKPDGPQPKRGFGFFQNRTYLFWIPLGIVGAGALPAILFWGLEREDPVWGIPSRALFKIQQEKAQARRITANF